MGISGLIKNQKVKIKDKPKQGLVKVIALQTTSTPGVLKKFKVKPYTKYHFIVQGYKKKPKANGQKVFLYLIAGKKKVNLLPDQVDINLTEVDNNYAIAFDSLVFREVVAGILFTNPSVDDRFYFSVLKVKEIEDKKEQPAPVPTPASAVAVTQQLNIKKPKLKKQKMKAKMKGKNRIIIPAQIIPKQKSKIPPPTVAPPPPVKKEQVPIQIPKEIVPQVTPQQSFKYVFVVTDYNCKRWVDMCVKSIMRQERKNWICLLCDDCSSDGSYDRMKKYAKEPNFYLFRTKKNVGACYVRYHAIDKYKKIINDEDVILLIGGDDYLPHEKVLNILDKAYKKYNAQVTYGNWRDLSGKEHQLHELPHHIIKNKSFRQYKWVTTAINTFKYYLFKTIPVTYFQESTGKWIRNCTDLAVMYPVMEQANRIIPIDKVIYVYNSRYAHNTIARFGLKDKGRFNKIIRSMPPFYGPNN